MWATSEKEFKIFVDEFSKQLPVLVVFGFRTSILTKSVISLLENIIKGENGIEKFKYICLDIEENKDAIDTYNIRTSPYIVIFKNSVIENTLKIPFTPEQLQCLIS